MHAETEVQHSTDDHPGGAVEGGNGRLWHLSEQSAQQETVIVLAISANSISALHSLGWMNVLLTGISLPDGGHASLHCTISVCYIVMLFKCTSLSLLGRCMKLPKEVPLHADHV